MSNPYKTCEHSKPIKDENGHFDDIMCCYFNNDLKWCQDIHCPLDVQEVENER